MKNITVFLSENFQFLEVKFSIYLNRRVFIMNFRNSGMKGLKICRRARQFGAHHGMVRENFRSRIKQFVWSGGFFCQRDSDTSQPRRQYYLRHGPTAKALVSLHIMRVWSKSSLVIETFYKFQWWRMCKKARRYCQDPFLTSRYIRMLSYPSGNQPREIDSFGWFKYFKDHRNTMPI